MCLRTIWVQQIPVIAVRSVECAEWVMRKNLILDSEYRCRSLRIPKKQRIMADAQTERNVKIRVAVVEQLRLSDGVAHGVSTVFNALMRLINPTDLADDRFHGKVMSLEDRSQNFSGRPAGWPECSFQAPEFPPSSATAAGRPNRATRCDPWPCDPPSRGLR